MEGSEPDVGRGTQGSYVISCCVRGEEIRVEAKPRLRSKPHVRPPVTFVLDNISDLLRATVPALEKDIDPETSIKNLWDEPSPNEPPEMDFINSLKARPPMKV